MVLVVVIYSLLFIVVIEIVEELVIGGILKMYVFY